MFSEDSQWERLEPIQQPEFRAYFDHFSINQKVLKVLQGFLERLNPDA